jgi:hypothetical protein
MVSINRASEKGDENLYQFEEKLEETFTPVIPDPEFMRRLQRRLALSTGPVVEEHSQGEVLLLAVVIGLCGVLLMTAINQFLRLLLKNH